MSVSALLLVIAVVLAGVAFFVTPARYNLLAGSLAFGFAGLAVDHLGG